MICAVADLSPFELRPVAGHDIHNTGERVRTPQGGAWTADNLDALNITHVHPGGVVKVAVELSPAHVVTIDEELNLVAIGGATVDASHTRIGPVAVVVDAKTYGVAQHLAEGLVTLEEELTTRHNADDGGCFLNGLRGLRG